MFVEFEVDGENDSRRDRHDAEIAVQKQSSGSFGQLHPYRCQREEDGQRGDVSRDGEVEFQPVPHDAEQFAPRTTGREVGVSEQEQRLLNRHPTDGDGENDGEETEFH